MALNSRQYRIKNFDKESFIPFAAYYDAETIITKNGEVLQTIKVDGFDYNPDCLKGGIDLRDCIREAISKSFHDDSFAVWISTVRSRRNYQQAANFKTDNQLAWLMEKHWLNLRRYDCQYSNDVYITILKEAQTARIGGALGFLRGLSPSMERNYRMSYLKHSAAELRSACDSFMEHLQDFKATRLTIENKSGVYYSQHLPFFARLLGMPDMEYPVDEVDLSVILSDYTHTLGSGTVEVRGGNIRQYGTILTIKNFLEAPGSLLDFFLQLPLEFIVTQSMNFLPAKVAVNPYRPIAEKFTLSGDAITQEKSGVLSMLEANADNKKAYVEQQVNVSIFSESVEELEQTVEKVIKGLNELGFLSFREDIGLEDAYYAQLPGNFAFIKRARPINTAYAGEFANIQSFPSGRPENPWGDAISIIPNRYGTPYFFNFHSGDSGHTLVLSENRDQKNSSANFLLCQAGRNDTRIISLDISASTCCPLLAMGGSIVGINEDYCINPLKLPDNTSNRNFCSYWIGSILSLNGITVNAGLQQAVKTIVQKIMKNETGGRNLTAIADMLKVAGADKEAAAFEKWLQKYPFNKAEGEIDLSGHITCLSLEHIAKDKTLLSPVVMYLLHIINSRITGQPTIIVLDEAFRMLSEPVIQAIIPPMLDSLTQKNALMLFTSSNPHELAHTKTMRQIMDKMATSLIFNISYVEENLRQGLNLHDHEIAVLQNLKSVEGEALLRNDSLNLVLLLNLRNMTDVKSILESDAKTFDSLKETLARIPDRENNWLLEFLKEESLKNDSAF